MNTMDASRRKFLGRAGTMAVALPVAAAIPVAIEDAVSPAKVEAATEQDVQQSIPTRSIPNVGIGTGFKLVNYLYADETTDCAGLIQTAVTDLSNAGGGTVLITWQATTESNQTGSQCVYIIDPMHQQVNGVYCGVELKQNVRLEFAPGVKMKAKTISGTSRAYMFYGHDVNDVEIANGRFVGERYTHVFSSGSSTDEWCAGIQLVGVNNVNIRATTISDFTGDGICMGSTTTSGMSKHVTLSDVICTGNRRQGVSLTGCDYVWIYDSEFNETQGTAPSDGIDIEPQGTDYVTNVTIENCVMRGNAGNGLQMNANNTNITNIGIVNCLFAYNYYAGIYAQTSNGGTVDTGTMYGNAFFQNGFYGLYMPGGTHFIIGGYSKNGTDSNSFGNNMVTYPTNQNNYVYPISPNGWATPANTLGYVAGNDMNITAPSSNTVQWNNYYTL